MSSSSDRPQQDQEQQGQETPRTTASNNFLTLLRQHGNFGRVIREYREDEQQQQQGPSSIREQEQEHHEQQESNNEDTIRAGNTEIHKRSTAALPDLFVPPPSLTTLGIQPRTTESSVPSPPQPHTNHVASTTKSSVPYPVLLPRTSLDIEVGGSGIAKVDSNVTLITDNKTSGVATTTTRLPPRPPPLATRDQTLVFTSSPYQSYNDDDALLGEDIQDQDNDNQEYNRDTSMNSGQTFLPSSASPRTQDRIREAFLNPDNNNNNDNTSPDNKLPKQQPKMSPTSTKRPATISNRGRSVSFGRHPEQQYRYYPPSNPYMYASGGSDVPLNRITGVPRETEHSAIGLETNMINQSYSNESHHHRENSAAMRRKRLQSDATRTINLEDLLSSGPYEIEAETNILKALEEKPARHRRYISETSTILSGVPDTMAHDFSMEEPEDTISPPVGDPPLADGSQEEMYNSSYHGNSSTEDQDPSSIPTLPPAPPLPMVDWEEEMPLIKVNKAKNRMHRRTMSVEDRLAGLTVEYCSLEDKRKNLVENVGSSNVSSGDAFQQNTAVLTRTDEDTSPAPRARKYTDFSDKLPAVVESDEDNQQTEAGADQDEESDSSTGGKDTNSIDGRQSKKQKILSRATDHLKEDLEVWRTFFSPRKENVKTYFKFVFVYMGVPLIGAAFVLFYAFDNPPTLKEDAKTSASASWWLLFCMRQVVTLSSALLMQLLVIDFLSVGTRIMLRVVGPILTLLIVQSRGWPFVFFWWGIFDFALIHGDRQFSQHWLFWQDYVGLFNSDNPSGNVLETLTYTRILTLTTVISFVVAIKRFVVGLWLSQNTFNHYGEQLAKLMHKMVLVSQVAQLSRKLHKASKATYRSPFSKEAASFVVSNTMKHIYSREDLVKEDDQSTSSSLQSDGMASRDNKTRDTLTEALDDGQRLKLYQLLDEWEEPDRNSDENSRVSISAVLRFRNALNLIQNDHAFSLAFGPTHSREACIQSSQETYKRLLSATPGEQNLHFETLGLITIVDGNEIDQEKARDLVKVFRPRRDGILTMLDFVKSTDSVYKEFRLLQASIQNSSQIDIAFENILNVFFYAILITIILSIMGFDPLSLFLSLSSVILAFAFVIGSASSKYFEGILFILVRRPYGIGDIIHISNTEMETNLNGSLGWIVQKVTLFETVATWVPTLEKASFNNGSLAHSRVINWRRSPNAKVNIQLHFPIETKYEQIEIFKRAVEEFMKVRPREWLQLNGFRVNRILTEQSYMQVTLLIQHRDSWQNIAQILDSKSNLVTYCSEVQKKLGMQYKAPALPVDLRGAPTILPMDHTSFAGGSDTGASLEEDPADVEARMNYFRLIAKTRHQIRVT
ncbi:mechanosensitive ion channel [Nitzschia inconspicua]|uniref:Mechanosensitive ion channel n=1 Tax=Nitzschia inconspicua TaxID=303405 RepID=A0A9K3L6F1_9STRA|nr:mechanosensitive ion channel [Nitzschia inconspicua]